MRQNIVLLIGNSLGEVFCYFFSGAVGIDAVHFADLCHENCFQDLSEKLKIGLLVHKVDRYLAEGKRNSELPSFQQAMENWLVGEK